MSVTYPKPVPVKVAPKVTRPAPERDRDALALLARDPEAGTLGYRHLRALSIICHARERPTATTIADDMSIPVSSAWGIVRSLEERGFVMRSKPDDRADQRTMLVLPTAAGRALDRRVADALRRA